MNYWKVYCMENDWPGLWQSWFKNQCVAIGWPPSEGYMLSGGTGGEGWASARNALKLISKGDLIVVQLKDSRVGRIGELYGLRQFGHGIVEFLPFEIDQSQSAVAHR